MASHRRPKQTSRARITVLTATAAAAVAISAQAAQAAPAKQSVKNVKAKVDALYQQTEQATEKLNGAEEKQKQLQKQVDDLQDEVARQQDELNDLQDGLGTLASAQYRSGGIDPSLQLFLSSDPDSYLDKASTLQALSTKQAEALRQIAQKKRTLDQQKAEAASKLSELGRTRTELGRKKREVQGKLAQTQRLLNSLTAAQRAAVAADDARAARSNERVDLGNDTPASGRAAAALAAAQTRLGMPYVYTHTGPTSFDCSGLTMWAYAQADVSLPRTSQAQANAGTRLSMSQLMPGDLVIFYGDQHHVGLYAGNGMVLHAPRTGTVVRYESINNMPFQFGVRI
ncbi:NlpC/P60 family protein [Actinacidiphila glaucinigra]|uniref:Cell wall-associated hydrolase, NlpC family n=1 Tax=Actinacidiphila glaucinigra TaxID=235986 RepID=A0A239IN28_9ACTN|nr:NlpC/P60 family protein [Actinacidiphila glaucinigra]SNS94987.1 Cell wall-associated hydrolase, NlpC family [Actinacidiphila glaucinigra]